VREAVEAYYFDRSLPSSVRLHQEVASSGVTMGVLEAATRVLRRLEAELRAREALRFVGGRRWCPHTPAPTRERAPIDH
jgi:hypothetical protein